MYCIVCGIKLPNDYKNLACENCFDESKEKFLTKAKISYGINPALSYPGLPGFYGVSGFTGFSGVASDAVFCPQCGIIFSSQALLSSHILAYHPVEVESTNIADKIYSEDEDENRELKKRINPYLYRWRMVTPEENENAQS